MKIYSLEIKNFRCIEMKKFKFHPSMNLFVGNNGSGKTTVLDALSTMLGVAIEGIKDMPKASLDSADVRATWTTVSDRLVREMQYPVSMKCDGDLPKSEPGRPEMTHPAIWTLALSKSGGRTTRRGKDRIANITKAHRIHAQKREGIKLPVLGYYGTGRRWAQVRHREDELVSPGSREEGYINALDPRSTEKQALRWIKTLELQALQEGRPMVLLEGVRAAIKRGVAQCQHVEFNVRMNDLVITFVDGDRATFHQLSDGQRNMVATVADIAYRCAVLNPHLGEKAPEETPGVVLIDEIDLHLHPRWQRHVLDDLRSTFPLVQFFATSHSPFIIQSLKPDELISLDGGTPGEYYQKSIEDIAEGVMGVEHVQRSKLYWEMFNAAREYYKLLKEGTEADAARREELKRRLDALTVPFGHDPAYQAFLAMEREAAGLGSETESGGELRS